MSVIRGNSFVYKRSKPRTRRRRGWSASRDRRVAAPSFHLGRTGKGRRLPGSSEPTALSFWMKCSVDQHRLKLIFWLIPFCFAESVFVRECAEPIATQQRWHPFQCGPACDWSVLRRAWYMVGAPGSLYIMQQFPMAYVVGRSES